MKCFSRIFFTGIFFSVLMLYSCNPSKNPVDDETTTRGNITIGVDDSYRIIAEAELYTFQSLYKYAHIKPLFLPEDSVLQLYLKDSIRMMITSRKLNKNEEAYLESKQIVPRTTVFAFDAVAFIVNRNNKDTLLRYNSVRDVFLGKISKWNQVNKKSKLEDISIVFVVRIFRPLRKCEMHFILYCCCTISRCTFSFFHQGNNTCQAIIVIPGCK